MRPPTRETASTAGTPGQTTPVMRSIPKPPRQPANGLKLTPLPKYHPLVYKSPAPSNNNTPSSSRPSSRGLLSPRTHARQVSEVHKAHQDYQRQLVTSLRHSTGKETPSAPHLQPHDSPGPATPLNLEESGDYLTARNIGEGSSQILAERLVREEQERRSGMRNRSFPAISPKC